VPEARNVTVNYIDDQDPANELKASETVPTEYDAEYNVEDKVLDTIDTAEHHYVLDRIQGNLTGQVKDNVVVNLIYTLDDNKNGKPDKYEATVTYKVINGTFEDEEETTITQEYVLAEQEKDGTWTAKDRTLENIPTPVANTGYQAGSWTPETPTEETEVKDGAEYTYTFV
ncbi:MucBP domain-containing protein, partial [Faecalicoccus pleomorphus]|uniref:MucBP domain-containing protein n=1 Tax=Faecalicoccus pleomorphus TaxID=1323 RepID=UPI001D9CCBB0|nr:hypothetical protein [Faecalicoccus pleomorphus]